MFSNYLDKNQCLEQCSHQKNLQLCLESNNKSSYEFTEEENIIPAIFATKKKKKKTIPEYSSYKKKERKTIYTDYNVK